MAGLLLLNKETKNGIFFFPNFLKIWQLVQQYSTRHHGDNEDLRSFDSGREGRPMQ
jgi:hypothetical protein